MKRVKYVEYVQKPPDAVFLKNLHTNINNVIDVDVALRNLPVLKNPRHATYSTDLGEVKCPTILPPYYNHIFRCLS